MGYETVAIAKTANKATASGEFSYDYVQSQAGLSATGPDSRSLKSPERFLSTTDKFHPKVVPKQCVQQSFLSLARSDCRYNRQ